MAYLQDLAHKQGDNPIISIQFGLPDFLSSRRTGWSNLLAFYLNQLLKCNSVFLVLYSDIVFVCLFYYKLPFSPVPHILSPFWNVVFPHLQSTGDFGVMYTSSFISPLVHVLHLLASLPHILPYLSFSKSWRHKLFHEMWTLHLG